MASIIATIYIDKDSDKMGANAIANSKFCVRPEPKDAPTEQPYLPSGSRTPKFDDDTRPYAIIRLRDILRCTFGFTFGTDPDCDLIFPSNSGLSKRHCSITISKKNQFIVRDWGSLNSTEVIYNGKCTDRNSECQWIMRPLSLYKDATLALCLYKFTFKIEMADIALTCEDKESIKAWHQGSASDLDLGQARTLRSGPFTMQASWLNSPQSNDPYLTREIGQGAFGIVTHYFDTRTGEQFVKKTPKKHKKFNRDEWRAEAKRLGSLSHDHIIRMLKFRNVEVPEIHLEWMPKGSLDNHLDLSFDQKISVLMQLLSALEYLDGKFQAVAHRDIKPENILVHSRRSHRTICAKLGDFGLSKDFELQSEAGTPGYMAPEIFRDPIREGYYNTKVDIWSLGVVIAELVHEFSSQHNNARYRGYDWTQNLVHELQAGLAAQHNPSDNGQQGWTPVQKLKKFLLEHMVVLDEKERFDAKSCKIAAMCLWGMPKSGCCDNNAGRPRQYLDEDDLGTGGSATPVGPGTPNNQSIDSDDRSATVRGPSTMPETSGTSQSSDVQRRSDMSSTLGPYPPNSQSTALGFQEPRFSGASPQLTTRSRLGSHPPNSQSTTSGFQEPRPSGASPQSTTRPRLGSHPPNSQSITLGFQEPRLSGASPQLTTRSRLGSHPPNSQSTTLGFQEPRLSGASPQLTTRSRLGSHPPNSQSTALEFQEPGLSGASSQSDE